MELTFFCSIVLLSELSMLVAIVFAVLKIVNLLQHYEITQIYPDASL
jgi:spore germination protein GerM